MKVLMVNSFHYPRGGSERCYLDLSSLLEERDHEVIPFSTQHEDNLPSAYSEYFVSHVDFPGLLDSRILSGKKLRMARRVLYSQEAEKKIEKLIAQTKPDIAHLHNIAHHISPSILPKLKKAGIPVVMTLHDYKLICPNTNFLSQGEVCERCKKLRFYNVVLRRCKQNSLSASLLAGVEMYFHRLFRLYQRHVDVFITPSEFLRRKLIEFGIRNPITHLPNFIDASNFEFRTESDEYCLYFGRLAEEKGVRTLVRAMKESPSLELYIAGTGPAEESLREEVKEEGLSNITFLGHLPFNKLVPLIQKAVFTLIPSEWYENYPMSILESFACGTPVVGSNIGAIPELIKDQWNGLLFRTGDERDLAEKITFLFSHRSTSRQMGKNGRMQIEENNQPEDHYGRTIDIYRSLINSGKNGKV